MTTASSVYGQSLYQLAKEEQISEEILQQLDMVDSLLKENPDYIKLLSEPSVKKKLRLSLLDEAFGGRVHPYILNFLKILLENGALRTFSSDRNTFKALYNEDNGIASATVTSAVALSTEQLSALKESLEKQSGKTIELTAKTDPSLIGGLKVEFEGRLLDGTVAGRLSEIRKRVDQIVL